MNVYRKASNLLVLALMGIALWVFVGKAYGEDMWLAVALYWAVLTLKNLCDWIALRENKRDE
jgi:hypothetical protein